MTHALTGTAPSGATARSPVVEQMTNDFDAFFRGRAPALLRTAYLLTGDKHLAEDLVQDALARTFRAWRRLSDGGNPEAYARRVMYHLQVSVWRRRRVVETMPARRRAVVVLRYFEDYSEAETADILNCRVGTVKSHTARALSKLRELMPEIDLSGGVTR